MLYFTLVKSKLVYAPVAWNSLTSADAIIKLEGIQRKFLTLCYNSFFSQIHYSYASPLSHLNFHTLYTTRLYVFLMFIMDTNFVLPYLTLLLFAFLLEILEIFLFLLFVPYVKLVPLLDVQRRKNSLQRY